MRIRPIETGDETTVQQFAPGQDHRSVEDPGYRRWGVVAEVEGKVVGAGTIHDLILHPGAALLRIDVAPAWRRRGIGAAMYSHLAALVPDCHIHVRTYEREVDGNRFLQARGFAVSSRSYYGRIDPSSPEVRAWCQGVEAISVELRAAKEAAELLAAARVLAKLFDKQHRWGPTRTLSLDEATSMFITPAIPRSIVVAYRDGEKIGASKLSGPGGPVKLAPGKCFLSQAGVVDESTPDARRITAVLVAHSLEVAHSERLRVAFEIHDVQRHLWSVLEDVPKIEAADDFAMRTRPPFVTTR